MSVVDQGNTLLFPCEGSWKAMTTIRKRSKNVPVSLYYADGSSSPTLVKHNNDDDNITTIKHVILLILVKNL